MIAESQTAGRGRLGRRFHSPPNENLYTSCVLRPRIDVGSAPTLIPTAAIAVADAIAEELASTDDVEIKWPNDVLLAGRKTSGLLMELQAEAAQVGHAVMGIGVNLNVDRETFPEDFRSLATSLRSHCGRRIDRIAFTSRLYSILERTLDEHAARGFASLRKRYEAYFRMPGRRIRIVEMDGSARDAVAVGIDEDGALLVDRDDGTRERVIAGDVTLAKDTGATGATG